MARVLVVEDESAIAAVLRELLELYGHQVELAADGRSALARIGGSPTPEVVLLDLVLPGISGREVIKEMRSDPRFSNIPVIILTGVVPGTGGFPPEGSYQAAIGKPFDLMDVAEKVKTLAQRP